jgi:hypothetical protein
MKQNNIRITGLPEGEKTEQGIGNVFEEIITENFPDIRKKTTHTNPRSSQRPKQNESQKTNT